MCGSVGGRAAELTAPAPTVVRKLNELYKDSVLSCQGLSQRLQRFFLDKQRLLDRIQSVSAEKLIFSHAVHTVSAHGQRAGRGLHSPGTSLATPSRRLGSPARPARAAAPRAPVAMPVSEMDGLCG